MARGSDTAKGAATDARGLSQGYGSNAGALFSTLSPMLMSEAAHPAGFAPTDMAAMDTAAMQGAGGAMAGAVGQGALRAARTGNAGGADASIAEAGRDASRTVSQSGVQTRLKNAGLKESQRRAALGELGGMYGQNLSGSIGALGQVASNINADAAAQDASWGWAKNLVTPIVSAGLGAASRMYNPTGG